MRKKLCNPSNLKEIIFPNSLEEIERLLKVRKAEDQARRDKQKQNSEQSAVQTPESTPAPEPAPTPATKPAPKKESKESNAPAHSSASAVEQTIRVEVKRLDNLMNLIGELVLGKNRLLKIYDDVEERYEGEKFLYFI